MTLEDRFAQHDKEVVDKYINPSGDVTMATWDYVVRPSANGDSGPWTLTLPPVAEAKGRFYSIICRNADAVNFITVEDNNNDSECWPGDFVLNGKCDRAFLYSDGLAWWVGTILTFLGTTPTPTTVAGTTVSPTTSP